MTVVLSNDKSLGVRPPGSLSELCSFLAINLAFKCLLSTSVLVTLSTRVLSLPQGHYFISEIGDKVVSE